MYNPGLSLPKKGLVKTMSLKIFLLLLGVVQGALVAQPGYDAELSPPPQDVGGL